MSSQSLHKELVSRIATLYFKKYHLSIVGCLRLWYNEVITKKGLSMTIKVTYIEQVNELHTQNGIDYTIYPSEVN